MNESKTVISIFSFLYLFRTCSHSNDSHSNSYIKPERIIYERELLLKIADGISVNFCKRLL